MVLRIPETTGRPLDDWMNCINDGPSLLRFEERVSWLRDEHELSHGYARAIIHEHDLRRAAREFV